METILLAVIGSSALSALVTGIINLLRDQSNKESGLEKGVQLLLLAELERQADKHVALGTITRQDLKLFLECYDVYHSLGGNGYATDMRDDVMRLPIDLAKT